MNHPKMAAKRGRPFNNATRGKGASAMARCATCGGRFLFKAPMSWHWHATEHEVPCAGELERIE